METETKYQLEWQELTTGPTVAEDNDYGKTTRSWVRQWAAPLGGDSETTWAWVEAYWYIDDLYRETCDGVYARHTEPVVTRIIDYIWCRDPKNAMATEIRILGALPRQSSRHWEGPATDDECRRLCSEFQASDIRWISPRINPGATPEERLLISMTDGSLREDEV